MENDNEPPSVLVYDKRSELGNKPGLHALIAGVSAYPFLPTDNLDDAPDAHGMRPLTATSYSAYQIYKWLLDRTGNLPVPLVTLRLLLSPTPNERAREIGMQDPFVRCTWDNFRKAAIDWRTDAQTHQGHYTFFYFAGHGCGFKDQFLLLEGFGEPGTSPLLHAVDFNEIYYGMVPTTSKRNIARTQLYFVDACRQDLRGEASKVLTATSLWPPSKGERDNRCAPVYRAAVSGGDANSMRDKQSVFSQVLLSCLNGGAGDTLNESIGDKVRWGVTVQSLAAALGKCLRAYPAHSVGDQEIAIDGTTVENRVIHYLDEIPNADLELHLQPSEVHNHSALKIHDYKNQLVRHVPAPLVYPYSETLQAGFYHISATFTSPQNIYAPVNTGVRVMPPKTPHTVWCQRS